METKVVLDPVHGYIEIDDFQAKLLDTPRMQRLRRIRQLGFSNMVYPGANHTRFEHSMGVMYLASKAFEMGDITLSKPEEREELMTAALLHDIGHGPFSHATEKIIETYCMRHHDDVKNILSSGQIGDLLRDHGLKPSKIAAHISGETMISRILSSEIDVDKMDYLARDMHYTGVTSGGVDSIRLLKHMGFYGKNFVLLPNAVMAAESLLASRYWMNSSVYYHHVSRIAETMCSRACTYLIETKSIRPQEFELLDDIGLMAAMRQDNEKNGNDSFACEIARRLDNRDLYKRALYEGIDVVGEDVFRHRKNISRIEKEIAENAGVDVSDVMVDIPQKPMIAEMKAQIVGKKIQYLTEVSPFISVLGKAHTENWKMGVFAPKEKLEDVRKAAYDFFDVQNVKKTKQNTLFE
ncbi:HD domain-containing protein [Methanosarcinaceae archaeon]|nr:HD domain-containing protein [Methanosarcinaceae archaeon]